MKKSVKKWLASILCLVLSVTALLSSGIRVEAGCNFTYGDFVLTNYKFSMPDLCGNGTLEFNGKSGKYGILMFGSIGDNEYMGNLLRSISRLSQKMDMSEVDIYAFDTGNHGSDDVKKAMSGISTNIHVGSAAAGNADYNSLYQVCCKAVDDTRVYSPIIVFTDKKGIIYTYLGGGYVERNEKYLISCILQGGMKLDYDMSVQTFKVTGNASYSYANEILKLINAERTKKGLGALQMDEELLQNAMQRAAEMQFNRGNMRPNGDPSEFTVFDQNRFSAFRELDGGEPFQSYTGMTPEQVVAKWMESEEAKRLILYDGISCAGVGFVTLRGYDYWVLLAAKGNVINAQDYEDGTKVFYVDTDEVQYVPEVKPIYTGMRAGASIKVITIRMTRQTSCEVDVDSFLWTSSNPSVATVEVGTEPLFQNIDGSQGEIVPALVITGVNAGTAEITGTNIGRPSTKVSFPVSVEGAVQTENKPSSGFGWGMSGGKSYWYEDGIRQGTVDDPKGVMGDGTVRGREIADPGTPDEKGNASWFWLDAVYDGAKAVSKEVWMPYIYQDEKDWDDEKISGVSRESGDMAAQVEKAIRAAKDGVTDSSVIGKWVRYDSQGRMIKGWYTVKGSDVDLYPSQAGNTYYYDYQTGLMAKGTVTIEGKTYHFDEVSGALQSGTENGSGTDNSGNGSGNGNTGNGDAGNESGSSAEMDYGELDGRKVYADISQANAGDIVLFGQYEQDGNEQNGKELIPWHVLEKADGKAVLLSVYTLDAQPYHDYLWRPDGTTDPDEYRNGVTWETCSLRRWLNNDFYSAAFNEKQAESIVTTKVINDDNPFFAGEDYHQKSIGGNDTEDKVWLLSFAEVEKYFHIPVTKATNPYYNGTYDSDLSQKDKKYALYCYAQDHRILSRVTNYAIMRNAYYLEPYVLEFEEYQGYDFSHAVYMSYWWMRSPGMYNVHASGVTDEGILYDGCGQINDPKIGVRPAITIKY